MIQVPGAHTYNPSYLGNRNQEDQDYRPAKANCEPLSKKYPKQNRAGGVAQVLECLSSKHKARSSNPNTKKINKYNKKDKLMISILFS
jgi:hypothetical protein